MDKVEKMKQEKQYQDYVKQKTPVHNVYVNMAKAFVTGDVYKRQACYCRHHNGSAVCNLRLLRCHINLFIAIFFFDPE